MHIGVFAYSTRKVAALNQPEPGLERRSHTSAAQGICLEKENDGTSVDAPLEVLRRRFALRLDAALDAAGYPALKASRLKALAIALGVDISAATSLTSGRYLPEYEQLLSLCGLLSRQPGYFLDEHVLDVPPGTTVVKPMEAGEDLVLRLPSEVLDADAAWKGLRYWRTPLDLGFGIVAGEYLIARDPALQLAAEPRKLYLYCGPQGYDVLRCTDVDSDRAVFHAEAANNVPLIVPVRARAGRTRGISQLVASVRCGSSLHWVAAT